MPLPSRVKTLRLERWMGVSRQQLVAMVLLVVLPLCVAAITALAQAAPAEALPVLKALADDSLAVAGERVR